MGIELKTTSGSITLTTPKINSGSGGSVDLSNYYTKSQTDAKIQEVVDSIPEVDLSEYATELYVENRVARETGDTMEWLEKYYAKKTDIPDTSLYVTGEYVQLAINESLPDLSPYAKTEDIPDVSGYLTAEDVSQYQTESQVNTLIDNALAEIGVAEESEY